MREIVFDTETTGLDPDSGHRVVEIGCIELVNHMPTGNAEQWYINPERDMPEDAFRIHGLSGEFLSDKPVFAEIFEDFLDFVGDGRLVAHNAFFDLKFINAELKAVGAEPYGKERIVDTLALARSKYPGGQHSLDALCRRFDIDLSRREKHGALLDAELLADVYLELIGGRQPGLSLAAVGGQRTIVSPQDREVRPPRPHAPTADELAAHEAFLEQLSEPIWKREAGD
jgi:DNA polymerase-3 subunit epsilon